MCDALDLLSVEGLEANYGQSQVLFGVSLRVAECQVATLLGRNGMGKTTTIHSIMGMVSCRAGRIFFAGQSLAGLPSYRVAQAGIGLVPEGRQIFPNLTVRENLVATASNRRGEKDPWNLEKIFSFFPNLRSRQARYGNELSGGEQQMLAIGRALMTNPRLLILDEATEGLAPRIRAEVYQFLEQLKTRGLAILIIDKDLKALTRIADVHYMLEKGRIVWTGSSVELAMRKDIQHRYLGI